MGDEDAGGGDESEKALSVLDALVDLGRWDDVARRASALVSLDPDDAVALRYLAAAHLAADRSADALRAADAAASLDPEDAWGHRLRARALQRLGRTVDARAAASAAAHRDPHDPQSWVLLAEIETDAGDETSAQRAIDAAARRGCTAPVIDALHGGLALRRGRWLRAEECYRRVLAVEPEDAAALHNLGLAVEQQGDTRRAVDHFAAAARLEPDRPEHRRAAVSASLGPTTSRVLTAGCAAVAVVLVNVFSPWVLLGAAAGLAAATGVVVALSRRRHGLPMIRQGRRADRALVRRLRREAGPARGPSDEMRRRVIAPLMLLFCAVVVGLGVLGLVDGQLAGLIFVAAGVGGGAVLFRAAYLQE